MNEVLKVVLSLSVSGSLLALTLLGLKPIYKRRLRKSWQYYIYLVALLRMLVPITPEVNMFRLLSSNEQPTVSQTNHTPLDVTSLQNQNNVLSTGDLSDGAVITGEPIRTIRITPKALVSVIQSYLWLVWMVIAFSLFAIKMIRYRRFTRFVLAGRRELTETEILESYRKICRDMGVKRPVPIYTNPYINTPMLVGIVKPCIVIPEVQYRIKHCQMIFRHELTHYRRRDILYKWFVQLVLCIHWYNPIAYVVRKEIYKNCELACDESVLSILDIKEKRDYGDTLMASIQNGGNYGNVAVSITMSEDGRNLKERLESILTHSNKPMVVRVLSYAIAVMLIAGAAFLGAYTGTKPGATEAGTVEAPVCNTDDADKDSDTDLWEGRSMGENIGDGIDWFKNNSLVNNYGSQQNYYYQDGYIFGIEQREQENVESYKHVEKMEYEGESYILAYPYAALPYRDDQALRDIAFQTMKWRIRDSNVIARPMFVLIEVRGPFQESPDQLLKSFYTKKQLNYFAAVAPHAGEKVVEDLLITTFEDYRIEFFSCLLYKDPSPDTVSKLVTQAVERDNVAILSLLTKYINNSGVDLGEALKTAVEKGNVAIVSVLLEELDGLNTDELVEIAYNQYNIAMFSVLQNGMSQEKREELERRSREDGRMDFQGLFEWGGWN